MTFFYSILILYILVQIAKIAFQLINISYLKKHCGIIPEPFKGHIDGDLLKKTEEYTIETTKFSIISSIFDNAVTIIFIFGGVLLWYTDKINNLGLHFILTGLFFSLLLSYAGTLLGIPFDLYSTFVIEKKYGFNTQTIKLWVTDLLKSQILSTILYAVLISASLAFIFFFPKWWWLIIWGFLFAFSIFMMYISPYVIEPLFNKFTPLDSEEFSEKIIRLSEKAGITVGKVFKMDASKRSNHTNAYFTGIGKVKRIILYDTLLEKLTEDEILAVIAHEAGHWKKKHLLKMLTVMEVLSLIFAYLAFLVLNKHYLADIFAIKTSQPFFAEVVILFFVAGIFMFPLTPLFSYFARKHEREADDIACELCETGKFLAAALVKLSKDNLSNLHPHPLYSAFYYSHPPAVERIAYLNKYNQREKQ